ncbi:Outer membrane porin OmpC [Paramixta manurensis]|uniref:Outer membrane porin OmpC n=1 Tax=Paramixta manurensis TaxID=2740817 RepID=A0A6M8UE81_9GAMM|nr:Outer membrane porin OmpC [Erwiniaceae bacterium PD-1]
MKLRVLSLMVPAMLIAGSAGAAEVYNKDGNKLDLYGLVDGLHYFSDDHSVNGDQSYIRLGFKGETQINDQLTGYGQWEYQVNVNTPESDGDNAFTRYGFAGLKFGDAGSFDYGRNTGVIYDVAAYTDMQPEFDGSTYGADQFLFSRANGVATYRNTNFFGLVDGLNFALQYQGKNDGGGEDGSRGVLTQNGDGYGMSVNYDIGGGVSLAGAFSSSDRTNAQNGAGKGAGIMGSGDRAEAYSGGLKYDANNIYLSAMFTQAYNASRFGSGTLNDAGDNAFGYANKSQLFEAYAAYQFDFGLRPFVGYNQTRAKDLGTSASGQTFGSQDLVKFVDVGATYYFNKNMSTYVDYKINLIDSSDFTRAADISTDDVVALGLVYQF